jgi:hypothetical protein
LQGLFHSGSRHREQESKASEIIHACTECFPCISLRYMTAG